MSWLGLRHKGTEPLYSREWNLVVDGLDLLYAYTASLDVRLSAVESEVTSLRDEVRRYYEALWGQVERPSSVETYSVTVGVTPVPLSEVDRTVWRAHVKVPSWAAYLVYIGSEAAQDFVLEPGDRVDLEVRNPRLVYARSLGDVVVYVMLETR